ncbi:hypothetical protein SUGI_0486480 [Cryptomeria japonica]|nr:hypothetical protein SUGI_0486480 [Cryptomeria japonica]
MRKERRYRNARTQPAVNSAHSFIVTSFAESGARTKQKRPYSKYDVALETNTRGPSRLMEFGRSCRKLQLFLHVSKAYVNGQREGRIVEKPFKGLEDAPALNILNEIELAKISLNFHQTRMSDSKSSKAKNEDGISQTMKDMALERARTYGWNDCD